MANFFFARYHITIEAGEWDKAKILLEAINRNAEITFRKDNFRFVHSETYYFAGRTFILGNLAKYKPEDNQQIVNENNEIDEVQLKNKVLAQVRFIIDPENSIIIYEESRSHIPRNGFPNRFIDLVKENLKGYNLDITVAPITEEYTFSEKIKTLKYIKRILIELVPSNPNNSDLWEETDERLRQNNITKYKEIQENKKEGESIVIDEQTESKFYMSEDGYGISTAIGIDAEGENTTISTRTNNIVKVDAPSYIQGIRDLIELFQEKLNEIIKRTNEA